MFINYQQYNWSSWLPLAEFAYNNATHSATQSSPFFTLYGRNPEFSNIQPNFKSTASNYLENIKRIQSELQNNIIKANKRYKIQADKKRLEPPHFKVGDKVWLESTNIRTTRPLKKLLEKRFGPFEILKVVLKNASRLKLPQHWKIHPVFHVSLLKPAQAPYPGNAHPPPEPVLINDQLEWEVSKILDSKRL